MRRWKVCDHPMQCDFGLRRFAPCELAWNFYHMHHAAGCPHTYRQLGCPRWSHWIRLKGNSFDSVGSAFFLFFCLATFLDSRTHDG